MGDFPAPEAPGASVFIGPAGDIFHTYSCYGREAGLPYSMAWVRHHDRYDD